MREAIGGAFIIKLMMIFIVIYIMFLSVAINYSITFRVKNQIINLLEQYEGYENAKSKIEEYVASVKYFRPNDITVDWENSSSDANVICNNGYCIAEQISERGIFYKVTTFVVFEFPMFKEVTKFPVSGETRVIYEEI